MIKKPSMTPLQRWNLCKLFEKNDIDKQLVDPTLTLEENMDFLSKIAPRNISRFIDCADPSGQAFEEDMQGLAEGIDQIIVEYEYSRKHAKFRIGNLILHSQGYSEHEYGDEFFAGLARMINRRGWGADQLRKCVQFAEHREAQKWLNDPNISWEEIRTTLMRKIQLDPIESHCPKEYRYFLIQAKEAFKEFAKATAYDSACNSCEMFQCLKISKMLDKENVRLKQNAEPEMDRNTLLAYIEETLSAGAL